MYTSFFGFREKPFELTPDPRFLYLGRQHKEGLSRITYGVRDKKGLIVLTGDVGTGKTTLVRCLLEQLEPNNIQVACLFNTQVSAIDFYKLVFRDLELPVAGRDKTDHQRELQRFLEESHRDRRTTLLIIDEAHYLEDPLLREIRVLANFETTQEKLLQILLVGQPELNEHLDRSQWRQLRQRIAVRYHLNPLNRQETYRYILTRMRVAGGDRDEVFSERAVQRIYDHSRGVPRLINSICDNALLMAYARERSTVDDKIVRECVKDLRLNRAPRQPRGESISGKRESFRALPMLLISVLLLIVIFAVGYGLTRPTILPVFKGGLKAFQTLQALILEQSQSVLRHVGLQSDPNGSGFDSGFDPISGEPLRETMRFESPSESERREAKVVVVEEGKSILQIVLEEYEQVDTRLLKAIQEFNPEIDDLYHITPGQVIRLPAISEVNDSDKDSVVHGEPFEAPLNSEIEGATPSGSPQGESTLEIAEEKVEERVERFLVDYKARYQERDLDGFLSFFSAGAVQNGTQKSDEIRRMYSDLFAKSQSLGFRMDPPWIAFGEREIEVIARCEIERTMRQEGTHPVWVGTIRWILGLENGDLKIRSIDYQRQPSGEERLREKPRSSAVLLQGP